jgi:TrpR-related protein YerC/YecD
MSGWKNGELKNLFRTIIGLKTPNECANFMRDVCTLSELKALSERWQVAQLVEKGIPYRKIHEMTGVSTATITRVAHWLHHGEGGYRSELKKMKK